MAVIRKGGYTDNDSSEKLKEKRRHIIEQERIFQLKESLMAYYDRLMENYELRLIRKDTEESGSEIKSDDDLEGYIPTREEIEKFTQEYANSKPKGF